MKTDFAPFLSWCSAKGIETPLQLVEGADKYRSMRLPPSNSRDALMSHSTTTPEGFINVVKVPLNTCIIGEDLPTLVEKLKYEKSLGEKSEYAPWFDLFPTLDDFKGMPRFWDEERLEFVKKYDGGQLDGRMGIDQTRIDKFDDPWALAIADSRSNFLPDNTFSITPMLDMFNHDSTYKTSARVDGADRLMLEVSSDCILGSSSSSSSTSETSDWKDKMFGFFKGGSNDDANEGTEVFVSYGAFDNIETLTNYGFISEKPNACNIEQFKVRFLGRSDPANLVVDSEGSIDNLYNTMSLDSLRLSLATPSEIEECKGLGKISDRNEIEVYALIAGELEEAAYDAKAGAAEAEMKGDKLVAKYLRERQRTLDSGLKGLRSKYPEVF
jgi:hypothetical protein